MSTATRSPGSALSASCWATSTGAAPCASRIATASRCTARRTDAGTHSERAFAQEVVAERELSAGVDQQIGADRLLQQRHELRDRAREHRGQVVRREARPEHGGDLDGVRGLGREPVETLAQQVRDPARRRLIGLRIEPVLLAQALQQLDQQERVTARGRREGP